MAETNEQCLPDEPENNANDMESYMNPGTLSDLLTPDDVARCLQVSSRTAKVIMMELPHIVVTKNLYGKRKRIYISEQTFEDFANGRIERKPCEEAEEELWYEFG